MMRKGRHILLDCYDHERLDIRFVNHIHSDRRGVNNRRSSLVMGGIRRHETDEAEIDVFIDGMNLGRGMTFKNVAAGLPMGGCKTTVQMKPVDLEDLDQVGFLAFATDRTRNTAGPDMGFPPELADAVNEHFSLHFVGGPKGPLGPTGTPTAHGVHMAVRQGARLLWGSESLAGKTIAVQGLGAVGSPLASAYLAEGARLIVCDRDAATIERFVAAHQGALVRVVSPDQILGVEAEIFSPAAGGGILTGDNIPTLRFKLIMGGANNVLRASSQEEEIELAEQLAERGILYQIDWWHNIAGVMAGYEEYVLQREADLGRLLEKVGRRCADSTWENLNEARREQITPTERAYRVAEREVYGGQEL
ncbi:MAG: Glu/Leu/Phe/Val dehydrogenase family protein [Holophagae bacterium]|nr:MAG: Glu/Leu/Phe/Val dehydrogenase family protein [Holophagae bacterium]